MEFLNNLIFGEDKTEENAKAYQMSQIREIIENLQYKIEMSDPVTGKYVKCLIPAFVKLENGSYEKTIIEQPDGSKEFNKQVLDRVMAEIIEKYE